MVDNVPGYLPETESATFASIHDARAYATELAAIYTDGKYLVEGDAANGYFIRRTTVEHDLGRVIEVALCHLPDCEVDQ